MGTMKGIRKPASPSDLGEFILTERSRLVKARTSSGLRLMRKRSDILDVAVKRVFELSLEEPDHPAGKLDRAALESVCIAAVGGYGRCELSPFSDIDITFIVADDDDPQVDSLVKRTYHLLMDVLMNRAGLKVGYAYRHINDYHDLPLEVQTALLDARHVAGSAQLFDMFRASMRRAVAPALFVHGHFEQRALAAGKWGASPYRVEPNIKEGVGGLRDLQTARWLAQIALGASQDNVWHILQVRGLITKDEAAEVQRAARFLARLRNALHVVCGRAVEVLSVDRRAEVAAALGYREGSDALLRTYLRHSGCIAHAYRRVARACREQALEIEQSVVAQSGYVNVTDSALLVSDPAIMVRLFTHAVTLGLDIGLSTHQLLREKAKLLKDAPRDTTVGRSFLRALAGPGAAWAVNAMADTGVLKWLIPEFARMMHTVPGDPAHELSVGAHSLEVVKRLQCCTDTSGNLAEISRGVRKPEILYLAGLLHDAGKISNRARGSHQEQGAIMARRIGVRLGLRAESADILAFLVRNHALMADTARLRDLNQKRTIDDFTRIVDSPDLLDMLLLLTAADVRSVGQATWSEVQMRFLWELHQRADTLLRQPAQAQVSLDRHTGRLRRELSLARLPQEEVDEHCRVMPAGYLLNTPPDDLASHIIAIRSARAGHPVVTLKDDPAAPFTEITICALDDPEPGLLARIAGVLAALGLGIHAAQVNTREALDRIAIDVLYVDYDGCALSELRKLQTQSELTRVLTGESNLESLCERFGRAIGNDTSPLSLRIASNVSDQHTVIEVEAPDQPGLLYRLTAAISSLGWNIHSARVSTWGSRAVDAFYVTDHAGRKLDSLAERRLLSALADCKPGTRC